MTSDDRTARAVGRPRRSVDWRSVAIGGPEEAVFQPVAKVSGSRSRDLRWNDLGRDPRGRCERDRAPMSV